MVGPVVAVLEFLRSATISETIQNQTWWDRRIYYFNPCRCDKLALRFGFVKSEIGHVCVWFSALGVIGNFTSVQCRVLPDYSWIRRRLRTELAALFHRNRTLFRCQKIDPINVAIEGWVDEYLDQ